MNIYEDYGHFLIDNEGLIKLILNHRSVLNGVIEPVYQVLNNIYESYLNGDKIDPALDEAFDLGYGYFSHILMMMNDIFIENFHKDENLFMKYALVIYYVIYSDDYREYLRGEELLTEERIDYFNILDDYINQLLNQKAPLNEDTGFILDEKLTVIIPEEDHYIPTHKVFTMIAEQLEIFEKA